MIARLALTWRYLVLLVRFEIAMWKARFGW